MKNNIKEEFIKLEEFRDSLKFKIKKLTSIEPTSNIEEATINKLLHDYTITLWEINCFIEEEANGERDKFSYITNE